MDETSKGETIIPSIELEGFYGNPQATQDVAKTKGCSLQTGLWVPLLRTIPTHPIKHVESELVGTWCLHPYVPVSSGWEGTLQAMDKETWTPVFDLKSVLPVKYAREMLAEILWEQPSNVWFNLRPTPGEGTYIQHPLKMKNQRLCNPEI